MHKHITLIASTGCSARCSACFGFENSSLWMVCQVKESALECLGNLVACTGDSNIREVVDRVLAL